MSLSNTVPQAVLSITVGLIIGLSISMSRLFSKNHFEVVGKVWYADQTHPLLILNTDRCHNGWL